MLDVAEMIVKSALENIEFSGGARGFLGMDKLTAALAGTDAVAGSAAAREFTKRGDFQAARIGFGIALRLHSVDGDHEDVLNGRWKRLG